MGFKEQVSSIRRKLTGERIELTLEEKQKIVKEFCSNISPLPLEIPEGLPFDIDLIRQKERLVSHGFHKRLKITEREYRDSLPRSIVQPEDFRGRLDIPILVDPRVPLRLQYRSIGIEYDFDKTVKVEDWPDDPGGYKTPMLPYVTWVRLHEGNDYQDITALNTRRILAPDERGGSIFDCAAFCIAHPEILGAMGIILPGTTVDYSEAKPSLKAKVIESLFPGFPAIRADQTEYAAIFNNSFKTVGPIWLDWGFPRIFSMVCGR